ncbi:MAG: hypothetical protein HLUCCA11_10620 [Phormidesmis priestleyi Ana]|uniref:Uncharacterized protein n=1 Tax=Phormidesmis priestleyi Ana TaxID=1666911 RepID=A0A0P7YYR9_9CYAN|nr:MAG: hypothetical protein HLUCCA11_10620 [Phormidesmis priestleyi Ana]
MALLGLLHSVGFSLLGSLNVEVSSAEFSAIEFSATGFSLARFPLRAFS